MHLIFSGEGSTDIGACYPSSEVCTGSAFRAGPMARIIDKLVECFQGYEHSHIDTEQVTYVSESYLADHRPDTSPKQLRLPGKKKAKETSYFYRNARALAIAAMELANAEGTKVIAVLFRDSDGTASAGRGEWQNKYDSMVAGFAAEEFTLGVPMLPQPKSEAWLLCAVRPNAYQHCHLLEQESGNDAGANPLKAQLSEALNGHDDVGSLNQMIIEGGIDPLRIDMPSFNRFKDDLHRAVMAGRQQGQQHLKDTP